MGEAKVIPNNPDNSKMKKPLTALDVARSGEASVVRNSSIIKKEYVDSLPTFRMDEIAIGSYLGSGGFNHVFELRSIENKGEEDPDRSSAKDYLVSTCSVKQKGKKNSGRYAVKVIREDIFDDESLYLTAIKDIVIEAHFMAALKHVNMLQIRALIPCDSDTSPGSLNKIQDAGYLIVMDRLYGTLRTKYDQWEDRSMSLRVMISKKKKAELFRERVRTCYELAEVFKYIHSFGIIYRDIKPENIGFDLDGNVKVFDLGLCKELSKYEKDENGAYKLSMAGAPRYMAPEVARGDPYNQSADYYAFGIVVYEIFTLFLAFEGWTFDKIKEHAKGDKVDLDIPSNVKPWIAELLKKSISMDWTQRPNFQTISDEFKKNM